MQRRVRAVGAALMIAAVAAGCSGDNGNGPNPSITLSLSSSALTIVQGGTDHVTATITRTNFTGAINITVEGAPSGVTGTVSDIATTGNTTTGTVTIAVDAATTPGT